MQKRALTKVPSQPLLYKVHKYCKVCLFFGFVFGPGVWVVSAFLMPVFARHSSPDACAPSFETKTPAGKFRFFRQYRVVSGGDVPGRGIVSIHHDKDLRKL